jgi:hypothetical protein
MIRHRMIAALALAATFLPLPAFPQSTVLDQSPVPIPGTGNTTQTSEWLLQSYVTGGITCYQSFYKNPGAIGTSGPFIQPGGLSCSNGANTYQAITGTVDPFPIAGLAAAQGGAVTVTGGASSTSADAGGAARLAGGVPGATGVGGAASVTGGVGGTTSGAGGVASLVGGAGTLNANGGQSQVTGGAGQGTGTGGAVVATGGGSGAGATGAGGAFTAAGGAANSTNGAGGAASVTGGAGMGTGNGGAASLVGGAAGATGTGGAVAITAGSPTAGNGSAVTITASAGAGGTNAGGSVNVVPGAAVSTGAPGQFQVNGDGGIICGTYYFTGTPAATTQVFFIATRPMYIVEASEIHAVAAGGTSTLGVIHDTSTNAPGAGTDIMGTDFNLNATANTVQNTGLSATVATKTLAAGDRLSVKWQTGSGIQSSSGVVVTVCGTPQ